MPWKRAQRHGKVTYTDPTRQAHMDLIKVIARRAMKDEGWKRFSCPVSLYVRVIRSIPATFTKKDRQEALEGKRWPFKRPDVGNYVKLIEDAMNGEVYDDDSQICVSWGWKVYGAEPKTIVTVQAL